MSDFVQVASIAERLHEALAIRKKKQIDLANETGIDRSAISRYLSGEYEPKSTPIRLLANALDVSEQWLMGYDAPMERPQIQKNNDAVIDIVGRLNRDEVFFSVVSTLKDLDPEKLYGVAEMLKAFTK